MVRTPVGADREVQRDADSIFAAIFARWTMVRSHHIKDAPSQDNEAIRVSLLQLRAGAATAGKKQRQFDPNGPCFGDGAAMTSSG
jgi:hypothetical protein